jgi:uncharacterized membrane protein
MSQSVNTSQSTSLQALDGYKPSGKMGPLGIPLLLVSLLVAPFLLALLYNRTAHFGGLLSSNAWILVITSGVLGLLVGGALFPAIQFGKVRNVPVATVVAPLVFLWGRRH